MNILELAKECGATIDIIPDETGYYTKDAWITTVVFENCTDANNEACTKYLEAFAAAIAAKAIEEYKASLVPVGVYKDTGLRLYDDFNLEIVLYALPKETL